jgi:Ca2+-transporting ATPase
MAAVSTPELEVTPDRGRAEPFPWHTLTVEAAAKRLETDPSTGLTPDEAARRLAAYGPNAIADARRRGPFRILVDQFRDLMVLVLLAAAVVAGLVGEPEDTVAIVAIVLLNAALGFVQENRAERAIAALKALAAPHAHVRRQGVVETIPAFELVPGDLALLEAGAVVPADLRLAGSAQLRVDESALTGESQAVEKTAVSVAGEDASLGDRRNMAFKGTVVAYGRGTGIVVATGMATEFGRIAALLQEAEETRTPLQKRLEHFARWIAMAVLAICALIFGIGLLRGVEPVLMLLTAISLAVAAVPEALPAVVTISLALGARRLVRKNALIRRLPAVETLGSVTYICSDKTGTLTQNRMEVQGVRKPGGSTEDPAAIGESAAGALLLSALALCNDAERGADGAAQGDPTETALFAAAATAGFDKARLEERMPRVAEIPFSSERGRMTTLHRDGDEVIAFTKGAPESVLPLCGRAEGASGPVSLDAEAAARTADEMARDGLRVLAVAYRRMPRLPSEISEESVEENLTLLAFVGLHDPPRPEAVEAVALCGSAGITVVMVTGDHPSTAVAIARTLAILRSDDARRVLSGREVARMDEEALEQSVGSVRVYARVAPAQKIAIVRALQKRGEFVAMTGDGVNDAPALRRADIGIAMGQTGTDVAREAAHMVLLDDNFASIVAAIREGRRIYDNIRKFIRYVLTCNSAEIWTLFLAPLLGLPVPLLPIHILWINLVTDGLPGIALAVEPEERGLMVRPPRPPAESLFARGLWQHAVWVGILMAGTTLLTQAWAYHSGSAHWQSMVFTVLALSQLGHVLAIRSERESLLSQGLFSNRPLFGAVALTVVLQLATLYVPALNRIFRTEALSAGELVLCLALSSVVFVAVEIEKWVRRRRPVADGGRHRDDA